MALSKGPTYGDLLEMMKCAERKASTVNESTAQLLTTELHHKYPNIYVGRPGHFLDTVKRIAAPTLQSLTGKGKLEGTPLKSYLKRQWSPRIRTAIQGMHVCFIRNIYTCSSFYNYSYVNYNKHFYYL